MLDATMRNERGTAKTHSERDGACATHPHPPLHQCPAPHNHLVACGDMDGQYPKQHQQMIAPPIAQTTMPTATYMVAPGMNMILPPGAIQYQPMIAGMHMTQAEKAANAKRPWTEEEDRCLMDAIQRYGPQRWPLIASFVQRGRAGKQCRERWFNHLCPQVKKGEWTEEEDRLIQEGVNELGTKWSEIVKRLPGRTDNAIKNRYNSQQRRMQRRARAAVVASEATSQAAAAASGESSATVIATATLKRPRPEGTVTVTASAVVDPNKRSAVTVASPRRTQVVTAHLVSTVPASTSGGGVVTAAPVPATQTVQSEVVADSQVVAEGAAPVDAGAADEPPIEAEPVAASSAEAAGPDDAGAPPAEVVAADSVLEANENPTETAAPPADATSDAQADPIVEASEAEVAPAGSVAAVTEMAVDED